MGVQPWMRRDLGPARSVPVGETEVMRRSVTRGAGGLAILWVATLAALGLAQAGWRWWQVTEVWRIDSVIALALMCLGSLIAAWYALTGAAIVAAASVHRGLGIMRWGAPLARRLAAGAVVGTVTFAALPAAALPAVPDDLTWARLTHEETLTARPASRTQDVSATVENPSARNLSLGAYGQSSLEMAPATLAADGGVLDPAAAAETPTHTIHVVRPGECLWKIAAAELPPGTSDATIASRVHQWIESNPALAANPDLIYPNQQLVYPGDVS